MHNDNLHNLNPGLNIDLELLKIKVKSLVIRTEEDNIRASELLGELREVKQSVISKRESDLDIIEQRRLEVIAESAPLERAIKTLEDAVKAEMESYKARARMEIANIEGEIESGTVEKYGIYIDKDGKVVKNEALSIRTGKGLSYTRTQFKIKAVDFTELDDKYKSIDRKAILADLKKGLPVKGVTHEQSEATLYRGKKAV